MYWVYACVSVRWVTCAAKVERHKFTGRNPLRSVVSVHWLAGLNWLLRMTTWSSTSSNAYHVQCTPTSTHDSNSQLTGTDWTSAEVEGREKGTEWWQSGTTALVGPSMVGPAGHGKNHIIRQPHGDASSTLSLHHFT